MQASSRLALGTAVLLVMLGGQSPAQAVDAPLPPHAPTPDEALGAPAQPPGQAAAPTAADANEATRKAQENGSYRLKGGGMYEPPASRPAPRWNEGYGRT